MAVKSLRLSELANLGDAKREEVLSQFVRTRRVINGELEELNRRIEHYEGLYEVSSANMLRKLSDGTQKETADICYWVILIELRTRVQQATKTRASSNLAVLQGPR